MEIEKTFVMVVIGAQTNSGLEDFEMVDFEYEFEYVKPSISQIKEFHKLKIEYQEIDCDNRIIGNWINHLSQEEFIKYVENPYSLYYDDHQKKMERIKI